MPNLKVGEGGSADGFASSAAPVERVTPWATMVPMRLFVVALICALVACSGTANAQDAGSRLGTVRVDGQSATGIIGRQPAVGDGPAIRRYHDSGRFDADRGLVANAARAELGRIVQSLCPDGPDTCRRARAGVVVDIDDTLLDWYPAYARADFDVTASVRQAGVQSCITPAIIPMRALLRDAERLGVAVLLVTGRRNPVRGVTASCLERRGVPGWQALVMRTAAQDALPAAEYKQQAYRQLRAAGWRPVLSIGDQPGDLTGSSTTARFLLPNPLYRSR